MRRSRGSLSSVLRSSGGGRPVVTSIGFDTERYLREPSRASVERCERLGNELSLEFGGKLAFDCHAARVLPDWDPNVKIRLLRQLADRAEILVCIDAGDIARTKVRADFGIPYDADAMKLIDELRDWGLLKVRAVVIAWWDEQPAARVSGATGAARGGGVYAPRDPRVPHRCGPHRQRRRVWRQPVHPHRAADRCGERPRPGQR